MTDIVKWGILGNARIARKHMIPALADAQNCELAALASRSPVDPDLYPGVRLYDDYDKLLDDKDIGAVYIPLPNALHYEWCIRAMRKGKHVLCEKPMALDASQCKEMIRVSKENNVILMEAFMYRFSAKTDKLLTLINSSLLGQIKGMHVHFGYMLDWDSPVRQDPRLGGGCLYDIGCYCVDLLNLIMKHKSAKFEDVKACFKMNGGVDEHCSAWLIYNSGVICTMDCWFDAHAHQELTIFGEKGVLRVPEVFRGTPDNMYFTTSDGVRTISVETSDGYMREAEAFSDAIAHASHGVMPLEDTLNNMEIMDIMLSGRK